MRVIDRILARCIAGPQGCVLWTGAKSPKGYGQIQSNGRRAAVHRESFMAFHGPIPEGLEVDHLCRVRHCVNPYHLEAVTHAENVRRSVRPPVVPKSHCVKGHAYTPENTYTHRDGRRECRVCKRARNRRNVNQQREATRG